MINKEKIIKALGLCVTDVLECSPEKCPYYGDGSGVFCWNNLSSDALTLLKEQEEIIHCKDCKYGHEACGNIICCKPSNREYEQDIHPLDWFCADGDKREEKGNKT